MKRVAIIGSPGSGKTTFARKMAAKTKLLPIHLDFFYHQSDFDYFNNEKAWAKKVNLLIKPNTWIIEGNYNTTIDAQLKRADTIFYFDFPRHKSIYGVVKRRIQHMNKKRQEMPDGWNEKIKIEFLIYLITSRRKVREQTLEVIKKHDDKTVIVFKSRIQTEKYLQKLKI